MEINIRKFTCITHRTLVVIASCTIAEWRKVFCNVMTVYLYLNVLVDRCNQFIRAQPQSPVRRAVETIDRCGNRILFRWFCSTTSEPKYVYPAPRHCHGGASIYILYSSPRYMPMVTTISQKKNTDRTVLLSLSCSTPCVTLDTAPRTSLCVHLILDPLW